ncbi:uncharacterized protein TfIIEbeta isoform X2 [Dermacentor albipictus]|uniref:uncharacterized protein TfIIEbeta isoform X2 n=1 Tax=Dermacentor albipictus TaxID=60249 RepID=UPI0038FC256E
MDVMPPGIMTRSVLVSARRAFTASVQWPLKESSTSIDRRASKAPGLRSQITRSQSPTRPLFIHEFSSERTTIPGGSGMLGSVLRLKMTYGRSFVPSAKAHSMTVQRSLAFPPVSTLTDLEPFFSMVVSIGISKYTGFRKPLAHGCSPPHRKSMSSHEALKPSTACTKLTWNVQFPGQLQGFHLRHLSRNSVATTSLLLNELRKLRVEVGVRASLRTPKRSPVPNVAQKRKKPSSKRAKSFKKHNDHMGDILEDYTDK